MHIKELVLDDFKSFGRTTRIPLYEDFTVITGPNGSGKSNIIDGVLFALGLARTRGIRAEKLTDLIYNPGGEEGTDGGGTTGPSEATVEVILDNEDRTLERSQVVNAAGTEDVGDVDEIRVRRRVKETEDNYYSYYYLNDRSVNLSDIQDLLAQAGVTPEGYNVVMQGDVTEIINTTPYRRREIVDEIAGVAEFDAKKEDAFEELDAVKERIEEAGLRIEEKRERLERLADERETALEYQDLKAEKAEYQGFLKAAELEDKRQALDRAETKASAKEQDLADLQATLDEREARVQELEADHEALTREIERKGEDEQLRVKSEIEEVKGEITRLESQIEAAEERAEEAESERRSAFVDLDRKEEELEELAADIRSTKVEQASVKRELEAKREELAEVEAEIDSVDTEFDELKADLAERKQRLEELKSQRNERQREQDRLLDEARRRSNRIDELQSELDAARDRVPELKRQLSDVESELDKAEKNRQKVADVVDDLQAQREKKREELSDVEDRIREKQSEYAELEAKADRNGDASWPRAVTTVLNADFGGVHGAVGQLGRVPSEYATACETAAGGRLANVVVDDDGVGADCIDYLKRRNAGRATFLPLTEMDDRGLPAAPSHPGVVDFARNLVEYDAEYAGVFSYVLGSTLVVEDMDTARDLMGQYRLVTLEGDLVEQSGAMTGGSGGGSRYSFSTTGGGKLERIATQIEKLEDQRQALDAEVDDLGEKLDDARERLSDAKDRVRALERERDDLREDVSAAAERIDGLEGDLEELRDERAAVDEEMTEVEATIDDLTGVIEDVEADIEELEAELADSRVPELSAKADEISAEIEELDDQRDELASERNQLELEEEYAEEAIEELEATIEAAKQRKADAEATVEEKRERIAEKEATLEEKREQVSELEAELADLKDERAELNEQLREAREARDEQKRRVSGVESELGDLRDRVDRLEWEIEELEAEVGEYDPEEVPDHDEVTARIEALDAEMEALEPVNMLAIDEYEEVESELEDLEERRDVLVDERDGIRERIDRYEAQKKETFMRTYESIDEQFREVFERLSDGSGELHLENPEDPFEGGLTMRARPADKPVQRLDAMSGGEKSLTALSFIFAVQRHDPAPFYALDEVDAFLDAANAERVGEMVDSLAADAQFVVVSHRSALLERSDRAIGVTMQSNNVSAVTGIQLDDGETGSDADAEARADD
jgi:chromosome segregation protein